MKKRRKIRPHNKKPANRGRLGGLAGVGDRDPHHSAVHYGGGHNPGDVGARDPLMEA